MADLNLIRTQLLDFIRPPAPGEEPKDLSDLFEEWATWNKDEEVDLVCATFLEHSDPRVMRLLMQFLAGKKTPRALYHLDQWTRGEDPRLAADAFQLLEKSRTRNSQLLLLTMASHEPDLQARALASLERSATSEIVEDLLIKLETETDANRLIALLSIFRKIRAPEGVEAIQRLIRRSQEPRVLTQALFSLAHLDALAQRKLFLEFLKHQAVELRRPALFGLYRSGDLTGLKRMLEHLPAEPVASLQKELLNFITRMDVEPDRGCIERIAQWAAHAESPSQRWVAQWILGNWMRTDAKDAGLRVMHRLRSSDSKAASVLIHALSEAGALTQKMLESITLNSSVPLVQTAAIECLSDADVSEKPLTVEGRYAAALGRFQVSSWIERETDTSAVFQACLVAFATHAQSTHKPAQLSAMARKAVASKRRTSRLLGARVLSSMPDAMNIAECRDLVLREPDPQIAREAMLGVLQALASAQTDIQDRVQPLTEHSRFSRRLLSLLAETQRLTFPERKHLALRLLRSQPIHNLFSMTPRPRRAVEWVLILRELCRTLENDLALWLSMGLITGAGLVPAMMTLRYLLGGQTRHFSFEWLASLVTHDMPAVRQEAARLLVKRHPWTSEEIQQTAGWALNEKDPEIQKALQESLKKVIGYADERRAIA